LEYYEIRIMRGGGGPMIYACPQTSDFAPSDAISTWTRKAILSRFALAWTVFTPRSSKPKRSIDQLSACPSGKAAQAPNFILIFIGILGLIILS
jgi:hypothetical protein